MKTKIIHTHTLAGAIFYAFCGPRKRRFYITHHPSPRGKQFDKGQWAVGKHASRHKIPVDCPRRSALDTVQPAVLAASARMKTDDWGLVGEVLFNGREAANTGPFDSGPTHREVTTTAE